MDKLSPIEGEVAFAETCLADNDPARASCASAPTNVASETESFHMSALSRGCKSATTWQV